MPIIAPSLLAADFCRLGEEIEMINQSAAEWIHYDVMDGVFVPNISMGLPILEAIRTKTKKVIDVHLMIVQPERYIDAFAKVGADVLTIHVEACIHLDRTLHAIKDAGMKAGLALNPSTSLSTLEEVLHLADLVCLMSVNPGFGAQKFITSSLDKTARLKRMISEKASKTLIEIDGGVSNSNAAALVKAGADVLVAGNYVFKSENALNTIEELKNI